MSITVKIHGLDNAADELYDLERQARVRYLRKAMKAAATPIEEAARSKIPRKGGKGSTGALHESIGTITRVRRGSNGTIMKAVIGPRTRSSMPRHEVTRTPGHVSVDLKTGNVITRKAKTTVNLRRTKGKLRGKIQVNTPTRYAHLVEFGFIHVRGSTRTAVQPKPFMRPAWHTKGGQKAVDRFADSLRESLNLK